MPQRNFGLKAKFHPETYKKLFHREPSFMKILSKALIKFFAVCGISAAIACAVIGAITDNLIYGIIAFALPFLTLGGCLFLGLVFSILDDE